MEKTKTCLYMRVSTDRQEGGLESQERALLEYCRNHGIEEPLKFSDFGISGAKKSRPGLDSMMDTVRQGETKQVLVYSFSRYARSTRHLLESLEEFDKMGVAFVSLTEALDTATPIGRAVFTIISALAQLEREIICERVRCGISNARAKGVTFGRKKTRPSELIRALRAKKMSYRAIASLCHCSHGAISAELKEQRLEHEAAIVKADLA